MEKHYVHPTGFAAAITSGVIYLLCALFVALWPGTAMTFFNDWVHGIDLTSIPKASITLGGFIKGLVGIVVFFYIVGALFAWIYNRCMEHCQKKGWI